MVLLWHQGSELSPNFDLEAELMFARGWALQPGLLVSSWWQGVFPRKPTSCRTNKVHLPGLSILLKNLGVGGKEIFFIFKKTQIRFVWPLNMRHVTWEKFEVTLNFTAIAWLVSRSLQPHELLQSKSGRQASIAPGALPTGAKADACSLELIKGVSVLFGQE